MGISLDNNKKAWINALKKYDMPWLQLSDLKGWQSASVENYALYAIPYIILISPDGYIMAKGLRPESLKQELQNIFDK